MFPAPAFAHTGRAIEPDDLWRAWSFEPAVVVSLVIAAFLYCFGLRQLWRSSSPGAGVRKLEAASFAGGWLTLVVALVSPLHALGGALFSAHMTQHELLISLAAPLLVLGRPLVPFVWALPLEWRRSLGKATRQRAVSGVWTALTRPAVAFLLHAAALWIWHLPRFYQATLTSELVHSMQHISFLVTALLFWWTVFSARGGEFSRGLAVFFLFATVLQTGALGALLTFGGTVWYPAYAATTTAWGLTPLEDQQLGGLIMWIPGSIAYVVAALWIFAAWLRESERRAFHHGERLFIARTLALFIAAVSLISCDRASGDEGHMLTDASVDRGGVAIRRYGCGSCHTIPGITGARGLVGPPLAGIASRVYIGGVLTNNPDNMIRWIENPQAIDPKTAMPYMGVTPRDARDITAYLYTLR
jgi:cytochrome c oxidase assembly factor CtaG